MKTIRTTAPWLMLGTASLAALAGGCRAGAAPAPQAPGISPLQVTPTTSVSTTSVSTLRVPDGGLQPQLAVGQDGTLHLIYYKGDPKHGDVFYVRSKDTGASFSPALRVNNVPGSAIAMGTIRGAQIALGKNDRVHVAWNGSDLAQPRGLAKPGGDGNAKPGAPMLYARLNDDATAFEPQRNLMRRSYNLDGGGSVAADSSGTVYVVWHGAPAEGKGETDRRVWVAKSSDEGKTFSMETAAWDEPTGACGCCMLRAFVAANGNVYVLYRAATENIHRDMFLLESKDKGQSFRGTQIHPWELNACPMSGAALLNEASPDGTAHDILLAWETEDQVYTARFDPLTFKATAPIAAPGRAETRKYPILAANSKGETLLAWDEGAGWNQSGTLNWQVFDRNDQPVPGATMPGATGKAGKVPVWSMVAAFTRPDGSFVVVY